jgi:dihydroorotate dehydrogenase
MGNFDRPLYDLNASLADNLRQGPPEIPSDVIVPETAPVEFMGLELNSKFGIGASPFTVNSDWIRFYAGMGFDLLTYKSVRSQEWPVHPWPNWTYVDPASYNPKLNQIEGSLEPYDDEDSMANSFGVQSGPPEDWIEDYKLAKSYLRPGQHLILSVMPSFVPDRSILEDAISLAEDVNKAKPRIVEVNAACPNSKDNLLYLDVEQTTAFLGTFVDNLDDPNIDVIVKIGYYAKAQETKLPDIVYSTSGIVKGFNSINTMSMGVIDRNGSPIFGAHRPTAGISGRFVQPYALEQMQNLVRYRREAGLEGRLSLTAMGGVMTPKDIETFTDIGADGVQAVTSVKKNPYLAIQYKESLLSK